ncbi:MAG TPA: hypothetical protein DCE41_10830 [Cytophagales bacterium]|nr:hypothetical protein [Cytophagales bacterium]HAA20964.1 hypothetical protein [Cytophagales bacterium]HAP62602.1 hypothetical protein [Cytophagales bacterium]
MDFIDGKISNAPEFEKLIDRDIPTLKNGNQPQNIQNPGQVFDQEYADEAVRAFGSGDFSKLPHLKNYMIEVTKLYQARSESNLG